MAIDWIELNGEIINMDRVLRVYVEGEYVYFQTEIDKAYHVHLPDDDKRNYVFDQIKRRTGARDVDGDRND